MVLTPAPEQMLLDLSQALEDLTLRQKQLVECIHMIRLRTTAEWQVGTATQVSPAAQPAVSTMSRPQAVSYQPAAAAPLPAVLRPTSSSVPSGSAPPSTNPRWATTATHRSNRQYDYFAELDERLARLASERVPEG